MAEAEVPISDEVIDDDDDGDGEEASEEGYEPGMGENKHNKTNSLNHMETLKFQGNIPTKNYGNCPMTQLHPLMYNEPAGNCNSTKCSTTNEQEPTQWHRSTQCCMTNKQ
jgi:hypothetical protein